MSNEQMQDQDIIEAEVSMEAEVSEQEDTVVEKLQDDKIIEGWMLIVCLFVYIMNLICLQKCACVHGSAVCNIVSCRLAALDDT